MNILAIECSNSQASLCLYVDGVFACHSKWCADRNHDPYLFPALQEAMEKLKAKQLDFILVGAGPGSYGGVRVALAAAIGIGTVRNARVVSISSWEQLANAETCIVSDAKRGGWAIRKAPHCIEILTTEELQKLAAQGQRLVTIEAPGCLQKIGVYPEAEGLVPLAEGLVHTWLNMSKEEQEQALQAPPEPIYVRPPHITKALRKPWEVR